MTPSGYINPGRPQVIGRFSPVENQTLKTHESITKTSHMSSLQKPLSIKIQKTGRLRTEFPNILDDNPGCPQSLG